jgi:hypothetical protein
MSLKARLQRLERLQGPAAHYAEQARSRAMERLLHALENARREMDRREPLPELPYTEEDREDDRRFLEETIPYYRERPGWQTEEARAVLDYWEEQALKRLRKGD